MSNSNFITADKYHILDTNDINRAARNFVNELNLSSGSNGEIDIYVLMQKYLLDVNIRKQINKLIQ